MPKKKRILTRIIDYYKNLFFPLKAKSKKAETLSYTKIRPLLAVRQQHSHITLFPYKNAHIQTLLFSCKYERHLKSTQIIARYLADIIQEEYIEQAQIINQPVIVTTIPPTVTRQKAETYDHLQDILEHVTTPLEKETLLKWKKSVQRQSLIKNKQKRIQNVANNLTATPHVQPNITYIIIDDITTTGATLNEAKRALTEAGATTIITIAFAG